MMVLISVIHQGSMANKEASTCNTIACHLNMTRSLTKQTKWPLRPAKTQNSLGIHPVWSEPSQCAQWVAEDPMFLHTDSEDFVQTRRMPRLIWVFAGCTYHFVDFVELRLNYWKIQTDYIRLYRLCNIYTSANWHLFCIEIVQSEWIYMLYKH